jgi:hypothetical protein
LPLMSRSVRGFYYRDGVAFINRLVLHSTFECLCYGGRSDCMSVQKMPETVCIPYEMKRSKSAWEKSHSRWK